MPLKKGRVSLVLTAPVTKMNPILDAFLVSLINGISFTLWGIIGIIVFVVILTILRGSNDDDDDDSGTLQPVYEGNK